MLKTLKYSLIGISLFAVFTVVVAGLDYKLYTKKVCDELREAFRTAPEIFVFTDDQMREFYCASKFCISPEFSFTIWFDYFDNNRYNECIEEVYDEVSERAE